jgi:hypothetical protein
VEVADVSADAASPPGLRPGRRLSGAGQALLVFLAYGLFTVVAFAPLVRSPGTRAINNPDTFGNAWALAWVVHQAVRDPVHLFDANGFHPLSGSLAYTEPLLPLAALAAPVLLAGGSALLAHNLVLLSSFPLAGLGMYLLARELSGSTPGAFVAGFGYAFCPYRFEHLVHVQSLATQWLPLALLFLHRAAFRGGRGNFALLGLFAALQALSSGYYAVMTALALAVGLAFTLPGAAPRNRAGVIAALAAAAGVSVLVFLPYRAAVAKELALLGREVLRSPEEAEYWSANWWTYASPGGSLYPGLPIAVLAALALALRPRSRVVWLAVALAVVGVAFSLGPTTPFGFPGPFEWIRRLPGVSMLRTPVRLGVLALCGINLLAAVGLSAARLRVQVAGATLAVAILAFEFYPVRLASIVGPAPPAPPTATWLADAPRGAVLELPWDQDYLSEAALHLYWSTLHWQRMANGWGGFYPSGSVELGELGRRFPSGPVVRRLRGEGIRYVVVHMDRIRPRQRGELTAADALPAGVRLAADFGAHRVYEIDPTQPARPGAPQP